MPDPAVLDRRHIMTRFAQARRTDFKLGLAVQPVLSEGVALTPNITSLRRHRSYPFPLLRDNPVYHAPVRGEATTLCPKIVGRRRRPFHWRGHHFMSKDRREAEAALS
jgi:hypothetical protein